MVLGQTFEQHIDDATAEISFESTLEELDFSINQMFSIAAGHEAARESMEFTGSLIHSGVEITPTLATATKINVVGVAKQYGVQNTSPLTVATESETTPLGIVTVSHEAAKSMLAQGWAILMAALETAAHTAKKVYFALASKVKGFDKKIEELEKKLKKIEVSETDLKNITLDSKEWYRVKTQFGGYLGIAETTAIDGDFFKTLEDSIESYTKTNSLLVKGLVDAIVDNTKAKDESSSVKIISNLNSVIKDVNVTNQLAEILGADSKTVDAVRAGTAGATKTHLARLDGRGISTLIVRSTTGKKLSVRYIREGLSKEFIKTLRKEDTNVPGIDDLTSLLKATKKIKIKDGDKALDKVAKAIKDFDKEIKDAKDKTPEEILALTTAKAALQQLSPALTKLVRDSAAFHYNFTQDVIALGTILAKEYKDVGKKKGKKEDN